MMYVKWIEFREERDHFRLMWSNKAITGKTDGLYIKQMSTEISCFLLIWFCLKSAHFPQCQATRDAVTSLGVLWIPRDPHSVYEKSLWLVDPLVFISFWKLHNSFADFTNKIQM